MPIAILPIVRLDQDLVVALVERDRNLHCLEFLGMIKHRHMLLI